ncbi:MAG: hypothetical protein U1E89_15070 [Burkholderiaceae bacterium]
MTRRNMRTAWVAPLIGAAAVLAAPVAGADNGPRAQRIVIDPDTKRARMPEHDEVAAAAAAAAAQSGARTAAASEHPTRSLLQSHPVAPLLQSRPFAAQLGAKGHRVDASRLSFTVVQRGADGRFTSQCVTGESAVSQALGRNLQGGTNEQ